MEFQDGRARSNSLVKGEKSIAGLYDMERSLGSGHFAVVKLAKHVFTGEKVAVKVIDKSKLDEVAKAHLYQEVRCMKLVQHPNVVRLYEVIDTQTKLYLILEYGDGGDMYDHIMRQKGTGISEDKARHYFQQIVSAINYCHKLHVVHRDLKPENVIFFKTQDVAKLTDFGFSNSFLPGEKLYTACGSLAYSAPEILLGDSYDAPAVDVWSLGVILYMMVCGHGPFNHANDSETLTMIMDCKYAVPDTLSSECRRLISRMLVRQPSERASLDSIMNDPWLNSGNVMKSTSSQPLISEIKITPELHLGVLSKLEAGNIATREQVKKSLQENRYDHITATYFLLAERILKRRHGHSALHVKLEERHTFPYDILTKSPNEGSRSMDCEQEEPGKDSDMEDAEVEDTLARQNSGVFEQESEFPYPITNDLTRELSLSDECLAETSPGLSGESLARQTAAAGVPARSLRMTYPSATYSKKAKSTPNLLNEISEEHEADMDDSPRTSPLLQRRASQRRRKYGCRLSPIHSRRSSYSSSDEDDLQMLAERRRLSSTNVTAIPTLARQNSADSQKSDKSSAGGESHKCVSSSSMKRKILALLLGSDKEYAKNIANLLPGVSVKLTSVAHTYKYGRHFSDTNLTAYSAQLSIALAKASPPHVQAKSSSDTNLLSVIEKNKLIVLSPDFVKNKDAIKYAKRSSSKNSSTISLSSPIEEEPTCADTGSDGSDLCKGIESCSLKVKSLLEPSTHPPVLSVVPEFHRLSDIAEYSPDHGSHAQRTISTCSSQTGSKASLKYLVAGLNSLEVPKASCSLVDLPTVNGIHDGNSTTVTTIELQPTRETDTTVTVCTAKRAVPCRAVGTATSVCCSLL